MRIFILALVVVIGVPAAIAIASDNKKGASAARSRLSVRLVEETVFTRTSPTAVTAHCPNGYIAVGTGCSTGNAALHPSSLLASGSSVTGSFSVSYLSRTNVTVQAICARVGN